jgi:hypothetical protein
MEPLSKQELEEIIERDLPGHELASDETYPADAPRVDAEEPGLDIAALRERFLGSAAGADDIAALDAAPAAVNEHDQVVAVRPKNGGDPFDQRARPKTVVISGRDRRVVGRQG